MIKHAVRGIEINEESLAVDVIKRVGPGGEFVSNEHTYRHFKVEQSQSKLIDRRTPEDWVAMGSVEMLEKATEVAADLYDHYQAPPLANDVQKQIRGIVNNAEDHYGVAISQNDTVNKDPSTMGGKAVKSKGTFSEENR